MGTQWDLMLPLSKRRGCNAMPLRGWPPHPLVACLPILITVPTAALHVDARASAIAVEGKHSLTVRAWQL